MTNFAPRLLTSVAVLAACSLIVPLSWGEPPPCQIIVPIELIRAIDGDTLVADVTLRVRVRLLAGNKQCWAPEKNTAAGKASYSSLALAVSGTGGQQVHGTLQVPLRGNELGDVLTFGRLLGNVWVTGHKQSLGEEQIALGLASSTKTGKLGE